MEKQYEQISTLGQGSYGVVYKCRDRMTGNIVAIKKLEFKRRDEGVPSSVIREVSLLKELEHENIVRVKVYPFAFIKCLQAALYVGGITPKMLSSIEGLVRTVHSAMSEATVIILQLHKLLDVLSSEYSVDLVFECLDVDLQKFMQTQPMRPDTIKKFLRQILHGVAYCHSHKILHRDLKPGNLLIDRSNDTVKLADFGLARAIGVPLEAYTTRLSTLAYMAPELLLGNSQYSTPVDVWSVACIFAEMVTHQPLFNGVSAFGADGQLLAIFRIMGRPNEETLPGLTAFYHDLGVLPDESNRKDLAKEVPGLEPAGVDLLYKMLSLDPSKRITAQEALEHEYFKDVQDVH